MQNIKNFLGNLSKKTIILTIALIALISAMFFGGLSSLTSGNKNAVIETPEISTEIGNNVNASSVTVRAYVRTYKADGTYTDSYTAGTSCGTVKAYSSSYNGTSVLSGSGQATFDMKAGFLGAVGELCGLVATQTGNYYYLGTTSTSSSTLQRNYFKYTGTARSGWNFDNASTWGTVGKTGAYVDKGSAANFNVNFYFAAPITVTLSVNNTSYGRIRGSNSTSGTAYTSIQLPYNSTYQIPIMTGAIWGEYPNDVTFKNSLTSTTTTRYAVPASDQYYFAMWDAVSGTITKPITITATFEQKPIENVTKSTWHMTLSDAVSSAASGDTLQYNASETITSEVTINKNLTIIFNRNKSLCCG